MGVEFGFYFEGNRKTLEDESWRMRVEANESTQCLSFGHSQALHCLSWRPLIKLEACGPYLTEGPLLHGASWLPFPYPL